MALRRKKEIKRVHHPHSSYSKYFSNAKGVFEVPQNIFQNTRIRREIAKPLDYRKLAEISSDEKVNTNLTIQESQTSNSFRKTLP